MHKGRQELTDYTTNGPISRNYNLTRKALTRDLLYSPLKPDGTPTFATTIHNPPYGRYPLGSDSSTTAILHSLLTQ